MVLLGHWDPERDVVYGIHEDLSDVARAGLVPVYRPSGSAPLETHPEHQWVWVGGALIDAVVIHKEWQRYQQASMDRWDRDVETQPTTDDVLWEGETVHKPTQPGYPDEPISQLPFGVWFDAPPETHVQVVRSQLMPCPSGCGCVTAEDPDRNDCACDGPCCMAEQWPIPVRRVVRATDQPSEDQP
jgi:hypothetical protein